METKKCDQVHVRRTRGTNNDNYYNVEPKIPDMLTIYEEEMDDLKTNATSMLSITGLCQNNVYILNAKNESMNSQCSTRNKKFLFEKFTQIPTIPYPRCSLSGNDCIKKSILYTDKKPKFDKLPVIYSAPSSDVEGCHADDESNCCSENEKTYSVCESDDTYTVSDDERSKKLLDRYPDSFDSDSSYCLGASDEDSSNDSKSHSSVDKEVVDVVEKVINNYHNLLRNFYDPVKRKSSDRNSNRNPNDFGKPEDSLTEIILEPPDMFSDPPIVSSSETTHQGMPNTVDTQEKVSSSNSISDRLEDEQEFNLEDLSSDNIFKSETAIQCAIKSLRESEDFDCKDGFSDESTIEADDLESFYSESDPLNSTLTDDLYRFAGDSDISSEFKIPRVYVSLSDDFNVNRRDSDQQDSVDGILDSFPNRPDDGILFIDADEDANQICNPDTTFYTDSKLDQLTDPLSGEKTSIRTYLSDKSIHSSDPTLSPSQSAKNQFHSSDYAISSPYSNTNTDDTNGTFDSVESIQSNIQGDKIDSLLFNSWQPVFASEKNNSTGSSADDHEIDSYTESCKSSTCEVDDDLIGGEEDALDSKEKKNFSYDRSRTFDVESYAESVIYEDKNSKNNTPVGSINEEFAESKEHEFKIDFSVIPKTEKCQQFLYDDLRNNLPVGLKIENDANDSQPSFQNNLSTVPKIEECVRNLEQNFENNFSVVPKIEESAEYSRKELENDLSVVPKVEKYANTEQNFQNNIPVVSKLENDANNLHQSFQNNLSMVLKIEQCLRNSIQSDENDFSLVPKIEESAEYSDNELKNDLSMVPETEYYAEKSVQNFQNNLSMIPKIEECIENLEHNFKNDFSLVPKIEECIENLEHKFKNNFSLVPKIEECIENLEHNFKNNFPSFPKDEDYSENTPYNFENNSSMVPKIEKCSQNWACNFVEIPSAFPAQEKLLDSGNDSSVVCGKENSDENNFEKISSKMAEKLDPLNDSISENDNYVNPSNFYDNVLTLKKACYESGNSKCSLCLKENPVYEIIQQLFKQWESRCVEIVLLNTVPGPGPQDRKLDGNFDIRTSTTDSGIWAKNRFEECANKVDYARTSDGGNNEMRDSVMESASTVLISSDRFDGTPNRPSSCSRTVGEARRRSGGAKHKQEVDVESVTGGRQLDEDVVPVAEHGIHATLASVDNSVKNDLDECGCWKSLSNDARSDLRKWRTFPPSLGDIMRSLNSSKLDLTGRVPLSELCVFEARTSCNEQQQFAAPCNFVEYANSDGVCERDNNVFGVIDQCVQVNDSEPVCGECGTDLVGQNNIKSLRVNNLEAIRQFSEYFKTSLETDSKLRQGIPDLNLDTDLGLGVELFTAEQTTPPHTDHHEDKEDVTSFIFSESDDSVDNCSDDMKNKKKSSSSANDNDSNVMESSDPPRPGILKSALKRSKKFYRKKHRVQFDESLNKFFEADYVILVRDEQDFDDEYRCECGNQFCYEGCYYEDEEDDDEIEYENSVDSPRFDFAAAFDPPMEFVDPVTLSPPDGYKDGCCQEASQKVSISTMTPNENHHHKKQGVDGESWENKQSNEIAAFNEKIKTQDCADDGFRKTDRRNQRYPFHGNDVNASSQLALFNEQNAQPANGQSRYIVETITMTTVTERRIVRESNDQLKINDVSMMNDRDKLNNGGILKGGKLWRNQETNTNANTSTEARRAEMEKDEDKRNVKFIRDDNDETDNCDRGENEKEFMLTFKLGNRVVPCNSLKPNSAVRQLFPDPRFVNPPSILDLEEDNLGKCEGKYLVTEESLRAFNEVNKRSVFAISGKERYPYKDGTFTVHSDDEDIPQNDLIKKTIERNTLRRSLMRYPRGERKREKKKKIEPSLEERIKQLTCVDDQDYEQVTTQDERRTDDPIPPRSSPPGEESHETTSRCEKSSSSLSSSSSVSSTYKKFTDLFARNKSDNQQNEHYPYYQPVYHAAQPDLGIDLKLQSGAGPLVSKQTSSVAKSGTNEARKQFLSSLAPLTACVTGHVEPNYGNRETLKLKLAGDRHSITSTASTGTEYSIGDIDDALAKPEDGGKAPQPDVVAGTPSGIDNQDELAMFVQQDAGRIERIKKRYSNTPSTVSDDDEHDDYGFSRRPSVRGIKPRFGSTTEILQQMQAQLQQPAPTKAGSHMTWPYYSAECVEKNGPPATSPRNPLPALKEEMNDMKSAEYTAKVVWEKSGTMPRASISSMQQQPLKIDTNSVQMFRLAPSDTITEVAVPYKCEPDPKTDLRRFPPGNIFQMKVSPVSSGQVRLPMTVADGQFAAHPIPVGTTSVIRVGHGQQQTFRVPCPVSGPVQVHLLATHHYENPQLRPSSQPIHFPQQIVVAKGTQTSTISTTSFYQLQTNTQSHYQNTANIPVTKASEHTTKLIQLNYNAAQHQSPPISSLTSSPTRVKTQNHLTERGIPEGAVSSSPAFIQDCVKPQPPLPISEPPNSTAQTQTKPGSMMYGMKV